jgi:hypothetical protein
MPNDLPQICQANYLKYAKRFTSNMPNDLPQICQAIYLKYAKRITSNIPNELAITRL